VRQPVAANDASDAQSAAATPNGGTEPSDIG
jgi:hypothetical protein